MNTTSPTLHLNAGAVSAALLKTAGDNLQDDCRQFYPKGIQWGEIAVTYGHRLSCSYVFHGALPAFFLDEHKMSEGEKFTVSYSVHIFNYFNYFKSYVYTEQKQSLHFLDKNYPN